VHRLRGHEVPGFGAGALALAWLGGPMTVRKGWHRLGEDLTLLKLEDRFDPT
jgi:hypothetical protein